MDLAHRRFRINMKQNNCLLGDKSFSEEAVYSHFVITVYDSFT